MKHSVGDERHCGDRCQVQTGGRDRATGGDRHLAGTTTCEGAPFRIADLAQNNPSRQLSLPSTLINAHVGQNGPPGLPCRYTGGRNDSDEAGNDCPKRSRLTVSNTGKTGNQTSLQLSASRNTKTMDLSTQLMLGANAIKLRGRELIPGLPRDRLKY